MEKLKYERFNNSDNVVTIDLHNGYTVIAVSGWQPKDRNYITTLFLKDNSVDTWNLIEQAESLEFQASNKTINSAILKLVSTYLAEGFFDSYIDRCEYEMKCFEKGNDLFETERMVDDNV